MTEALSRGVLGEAERRAAQQHLEECESCRNVFRQQTADHFPRLRNYTVLERIGGGGFGVVYKVIHHAKQRTEAVKILSTKTPVRTRYFQNEVHLVAKLRHPNITALHEAHLGAPPMYYAMDLVEGEPLDTYVRTRHVSLVDRIRLVKTVVAAVGYAHAQGIVHRDLKPQNILVDAAGEPHILDFGIAKKLGWHATPDQATMSPEGALGTFGYIAPEQMAGEDVDERADIYALGALLYHAITGEPARYATWADRLVQTLHARQVSRAEDLSAIIGRCVAPIPEQRYRSCDELIQDLDNYLTGRAIRAHRDAPAAYRLERAVSFVLRNHPLVVRFFVVAATATLLTWLTWRVEPRWAIAGADGHSVALVTYGPQTVEAMQAGRIGGELPGLKPANRKSWRLLHGRLMERLAEGAPAAVVWDGFFEDCQPEFDGGFLKGVAALRAANIPVVVGVRQVDINSEPACCETILAAVHGYGTLVSINPGMRSQELVMPVCIKRGFAAPVPGLAIAGIAAARHPDARLDLELRPDSVELRYVKRTPRSGESRWYTDTDVIQCPRVGTAEKTAMLQTGDVLYNMHVPIGDEGTIPRLAVEAVVNADHGRLQEWFRGRIVVVGDVFPGVDQYATLAGGSVHGCWVNARAIQSLLAGTSVTALDRPTLAATIVLWAAIAGFLAGLVPCSRRLGLLGLAWPCWTAFAAGAVLLVLGIRRATDFWEMHLVLAGATLLATIGPAYFAKAVRERQLQLAPELGGFNEQERLLDSTMLATASDSDRTRGAGPVEPGQPAGASQNASANDGRGA